MKSISRRSWVGEAWTKLGWRREAISWRLGVMQHNSLNKLLFAYSDYMNRRTNSISEVFLASSPSLILPRCFVVDSLANRVWVRWRERKQLLQVQQTLNSKKWLKGNCWERTNHFFISWRQNRKQNAWNFGSEFGSTIEFRKLLNRRGDEVVLRAQPAAVNRLRMN